MSDLLTYAREALRLPNDFGYSGDLPIGETWSLGPVIEHRDSDLLSQSNSVVMRRTFEEQFGPEGEENGWVITRCSHWAVGWVEHLSFRAFEADGTASRHSAIMQEVENALADYPVLDDEDFSRREYEQQCEEIESAARKWVASDAPPEWESFVFSAAWDSDAREWRQFFEDSTNYSPPEGRVMAETVVAACIAWMREGENRDPEQFLDREEFDYHRLCPMTNGSVVQIEEE